MAKKTDFGSDLSKGFGADRGARDAQPRRDGGERPARRPEQDRPSRDRADGARTGDDRSSQPRSYSDSPPARPWQDRDRGSSDRPASRSSAPARTSDDRPDRSSERPAWRDKPATDRRPSSDRPSSWSDREEPRYERREPDRGSRVREEEIGERWPEIPEWADPRELDAEVRRDLRGLSKEGAEFVGAHLFMAGMLAEEEPALAWRHARAARSKGGRIAVVRETVGLVAYHAGEWAEAIGELRAARRMSGGPGQLPVMADCERALGHPEKAIELSRSAEASELDAASAAELRIVVAGARADLGQLDAALAHLEVALEPEKVEPFTARLFYAYADLLLQADRRAEAIDWFMKAAEIDVDEETDAGERLTELAGGETDGDADADAVDEDVEDIETFDDGDLDLADSDSDTDSDTDTDTDTDTSGDAAAEEGDAAEAVGTGDVDGPSGDIQDFELSAFDEDPDAAPGTASGTVEGSQTPDDGIEVATGEDVVDPQSNPDDDASASGAGAPDLEKPAAAPEEITEPDTLLEESLPVESLPQRPASPPSSLGSLFSHNEGGL